MLDQMIANSPSIGIAAKKNLTADELSCEVKIKAFDQYNGQLYYAVLALEKTATGIQEISGQNTSNNYEHVDITRASLVGDGTMAGQEAFELISSGTIDAGSTFSKTFSLTFEDFDPGADFMRWNYTPENTEIIAMVWESSRGEWKYVNGIVAE